MKCSLTYLVTGIVFLVVAHFLRIADEPMTVRAAGPGSDYICSSTVAPWYTLSECMCPTPVKKDFCSNRLPINFGGQGVEVRWCDYAGPGYSCDEFGESCGGLVYECAYAICDEEWDVENGPMPSSWGCSLTSKTGYCGDTKTWCDPVEY